MSSKVQKYINNKICCFSNNVHKSDKKLKYGLEEASCQIIKDSIVNILMEIMMCNPIASDIQWYKLNYTLEWIAETPPALTFPDTFNVISNKTIISADGNQSLIIPISGSYTVIDMVDVNKQLNSAISFTETDDFIMYVDIDDTTGIGTLTIYFSEYWGNDVNLFDVSGLDSNIPFNNIINSIVTTEYNYSIGCLSEEQLCTIKSHIDNYCKVCN